ncbi:carboxylate--amine ligase [Actinomadura roseirufa]|uniref:carboxylate--amine ligase n=1 Tax=Actinomadura roseirufa TaxID=2094049 RepID=UPI001041B6B6|nr:ATP-grasp domain-containing protein [Actinomadura roseirufa]
MQSPPRLDTGLPVLLLRTDRNPFHHGTLGAIRTLGRAGVPVHAILEDPRNPAGRSRYLHRGHPWAPPADRPAALLDHLRAIGERVGGPALLLPMDDAGAIFVAEHADALTGRFVFPRQDPDVPRLVADKARLGAACREHGLPCPDARTPATPAEVDDAAAELGLPLVAKWARPWRLGPGRRSTTLVHTTEQAHLLFAARDRDPAPEEGAGPLILQRRIPPEGGDWFFHGYFDADLTCLYGGTGRKHLAHPPHAGHTVSGEWVANHELERLAVDAVRRLGCRGLVDLDFRLDAASGAYHLLDFNPRIGAQFRLFADRQGLDLARVLHLDQSGREIPRPRPAFGRNLLVENHFLQHAAARPLLRAGRFGPLRRADELAWYAGDDLPPFLAMGRQSVLRAARRLRTRHRG